MIWSYIFKALNKTELYALTQAEDWTEVTGVLQQQLYITTTHALITLVVI